MLNFYSLISSFRSQDSLTNQVKFMSKPKISFDIERFLDSFCKIAAHLGIDTFETFEGYSKLIGSDLKSLMNVIVCN